MSELFIFDQDDHLKTIISEDTGLLQTRFREEVNQIPDTPFQFEVEANEDITKHIKEENQVIFRDRSGDYRLFTIKEIDDTTDMGVSITTATCTSALMELNEHIIEKLNLKNQPLAVALEKVLERTRWQFQVDSVDTNANLEIEYQSSLEAMLMITTTWGIEFKDTISIDDNNKIIRTVSFQHRLGEDNGLRFEIDYNATNVKRTIISYPKTALFGQGGTVDEKIIDFSTVEWKVEYGNPVDKPIGQKWIGDPNALSEYGINKDGTLMHRQGIFKDTQIESPEELLEKTWEALIQAQQPEVNYQLIVDTANERFQLGDTAICIDRNFARPIEIQTRIIAMEYDVLSPSDTVQVEMGQFLNLYDDRIDKVIEDIDRNREKWESVGTISKDSYPDKKPSPPTNVEAYGAFKTIQIYWDYTDEIYVDAYEVYGSQVKEFEPDSQHLLWKGNVSTFSHIVETDQKWYYYVRAINHHGTASEWSEQVEANTHRVISEDILFGEELAERMRELHNISDIIGTDGVSFKQISQEAKNLINQQAKQYTDSEISDTRDEIMEDVSSLSNELEYVEGQLVDKVNINDVYTISDIDNMISNKVSLTKYETDYNGVIQDLEQHSSLIEQNEIEIRNRVEQTIFNNETGILRQSISDVQQLAEGIETTVSSIEFDVTDNQNRMNQAESTINQLATEIDLKVDIDNIVSQINLSQEGVKIKGNLIHLDGTTLINNGVIQNAHIANGAIERGKLAKAIIGEAQIEDLAVTSAKIASINADKINVSRLSSISADLGTVRAGRLLSSNNNMDLNLNTGSLRMGNAKFTLGGGADIIFNDGGNRMFYVKDDPSTSYYRNAGVGVGTSINNRFPYVYMGTNARTDGGGLNATDGDWFTGFISNTNARMNADGIGNSVVGKYFHIRDYSVSYSKGLRFDLSTNNVLIHPMNTSRHSYSLGHSMNEFDSANIREIHSNNGYIRFRNASQSYRNQGFTMETRYDGGSFLHLRGTHSSDSWALGKPGGWRFSQIYLTNGPDISSDERLKENIKDNHLGLDFIKRIETKTYNLKKTNPRLEFEPTKYGVLAQQLIEVFADLKIDYQKEDVVALGEDGYYGVKYEQFIAPIIRAIQELSLKLEKNKMKK
ncbi:tail fiber domain-containing protein [Oceanobacillus kimchii]|uniref:tail fiber domain-containing protein n=1 Tax=Oceanobacillus kimchii TaxID=746691 RepID=UPI003C72AAA7